MQNAPYLNLLVKVTPAFVALAVGLANIACNNAHDADRKPPAIFLRPSGVFASPNGAIAWINATRFFARSEVFNEDACFCHRSQSMVLSGVYHQHWHWQHTYQTGSEATALPPLHM